MLHHKIASMKVVLLIVLGCVASLALENHKTIPSTKTVDPIRLMQKHSLEKSQAQVEDKTKFMGLLSLSSLIDDRCVLCQFIVERVQADLQVSGGLNPFFGSPIPPAPTVSLPKTAPTTELSASFLEIGAKVKYPRSKDGTGIILSIASNLYLENRRPRVYPLLTDEYERSMSRQVFRVMDITLEQICEVNMPIHYFMLVCKNMYKEQETISKLIANQRNPVEICIQTKMCAATSYINVSTHSKFNKYWAMMKPYKKALGIK